MTHREARPSDFIGKRIVAVDVSSVNCWTLKFDDGSQFLIETVYYGYGLYGLAIEDPQPSSPSSTTP